MSKAGGDNQDRNFIVNPDKWPKWPVLPMKRHIRNDPDGGFLIANAKYFKLPDGPFTLFSGYIWDLPTTPDHTIDEAKLKVHKVFKTTDEMFADGWMVD